MKRRGQLTFISEREKATHRMNRRGTSPARECVLNVRRECTSSTLTTGQPGSILPEPAHLEAHGRQKDWTSGRAQVGLVRRPQGRPAANTGYPLQAAPSLSPAP